jgi:hypothetical protein
MLKAESNGRHSRVRDLIEIIAKALVIDPRKSIFSRLGAAVASYMNSRWRKKMWDECWAGRAEM